MKRRLTILLPLVAIVAISATLDLSQLENYSAQLIPAYITRDNTPPNNQVNDAGATLGRVLFYDKKLSVNNSTACGSCHHQQFAFGDTASASQGALGTTGRHAMRLINARFADEQRFFWDERAANLEQQTTQPIQNHEEMGYSGLNGDPGIGQLITKMNGIWYYPQLFTLAYGDAQITEQRIQLALAKFVRSIQSFDSKFDAGRVLAPNDGAPFANFTAQENQGKQLFLAAPQFDANGNRVAGGAGCAGCHRAPEFDIVPNSGNNGVIGSFAGGTDLTNTRAPSLRDVVDINGDPNAGFMHNAGANNLNTLLDVIDHYNTIPANNPNLDPKLRPGGNPQKLQLTTQEKQALIAFIRTLTGTDVYTNPKWSNPFTGDSLTLINFPVGISNVVAASKIRVYPTVVTNYVTIDAPAPIKNTHMSVTDISGRVIYNGPVVEKLDFGSEPAGMYLVRFENGQTEKLFKR